MSRNYIAALVFSVLLVAVFADDDLFVQIKNGVLRGTYMETRSGKTIQGYLGIPFAKPPVGELRFKAPVAADYWSGVKNATAVHSVCPQRNIYVRSEVIEGTEDCLYLNVYKPNKVITDTDKLLPVMMFIHGGGWLACSGNSETYAPDYLMEKDIILVVANYRLGALGFLSTGDDAAPGNNGLKDQAFVLKWINENIAKFGGNPKRVTVFGESAGGASTHFMMMSPLTKGLVHGGIAQSGTALCPWAVAPKDQAVQTAKKLGELFNCPTDYTKKMVDCLRKVDPLEIISKDKDFMEWDTDPMIPFKPVVEHEHKGAFITEHPIDIIKSGKMENLPFMVGLNTEDGALRSAAVYSEPHLVEELNNDFNKKCAIAMQYNYASENPEEISKEIRKFYFGDKKIDDSTRKEVTDLFTDGWFLNGADQAVYLHTKYSKMPIYYYLFGHRGKYSFSSHFGGKDIDYGVCHADELMYMFPISDLFPEGQNEENDKKVTELMTAMWVNFATNGDPTPKLDKITPTKWTTVQSEEDMEYLYIGSHDNIEMKKGLYIERAKLWRNLALDSRYKNSVRDEL